MLHSTKKVLAGLTALAALALGGSEIADAASSSSTTTSTPSGQARPAPGFPAHGTAAHEEAEKAVAGPTATKAQAAAVKSVGGGTAGDVTTDYTGNGYEVTVTRSDGTKVEVHLDSSFTVMQGGPGGRGLGATGGQAPSGAPPAGYGG